MRKYLSGFQAVGPAENIKLGEQKSLNISFGLSISLWQVPGFSIIKGPHSILKINKTKFLL